MWWGKTIVKIIITRQNTQSGEEIMYEQQRQTSGNHKDLWPKSYRRWNQKSLWGSYYCIFSKSDIYSFFSRVYTHEFLHSSWPVLQLLMKILAIFRCTIHPLHCTETQQDSQTAEAVTEMNYSSQNNTVIFVDCEGLTPPSDAGLTDKAPPSSAACCRNRTPADGLETQQQTSPIDFLHFFGY